MAVEPTATTPLIFWVRDREQINLVITLPITQKPLYSSLFSSTRDQSNQLLPSSLWAALDTLDSNIPCFLSLKESWALRIFAASRRTFSSSSLPPRSWGRHENQGALATFKRKNCILMCKHARIFMHSKSNFSCKKLHYKMLT